jgi:23S rRNA (uracil1939-C5)-methyltransferase
MSGLTIITDKMVFGGDCIAKYEGKTIFVPYALPGEKLNVEIVKEMRDYSVGRIIEILEPSPYRVEPSCPLYTKCGGCNMLHISDEHQVTLRKEILRDAFARENIDIPLENIEAVCGKPSAYRSRFQFHNGGLMEKQTNNIIPIDNCPMATDEINHYLKEVPFENRPEGRFQVFASSRIVSIPDGFDKIIVADSIDSQRSMKEDTKKVRNRPQYTPNGRKLPKQKKIKQQFAGTVSNQASLCTVNILGEKITFDVQGFFQSNLEVLEKTIPLITEGMSGKKLLDMYSGCGTFSVFLKKNFENLCLVEHNRGAIVYAEQNLAGVPHQSYGLSGDVWVKYHAENHIKQYGSFDGVVIDPPRSGMEKSVCQWLCSSGIPKIKSLSCDIATHARDAKFLIRSGYKLKKLYLLDFYPGTSHIESLATFEKE